MHNNLVSSEGHPLKHNINVHIFAIMRSVLFRIWANTKNSGRQQLLRTQCSGLKDFNDNSNSNIRCYYHHCERQHLLRRRCSNLKGFNWNGNSNTRNRASVVSYSQGLLSDHQLLRSVSASGVVNTARMYSSRPQGAVGDPVESLETPALLLCLDTFESNVQKMADTLRSRYPKVALRAHAKAHKTPSIARAQIKAGARGVCCQTVTEAEAMAAGGIHDILLSNQVIGPRKLDRVASLAKQVCLSVVVDDEQNITDLNTAAEKFGVTLDLVIEVNVGGFRCGVEPGPDVVRLAKKIQSLPSVNFKGLHCYNGINQHVRSEQDRKEAVDSVVEMVKTSLKALQEAGIECDYVSGGGTGTFHYEAGSGVYTEIQPGSYIFMDADYGRNLDKDEKFVSEFDQSLYVLSTIQSVAPGVRAVVDAGLKALSLDSGVPLLKGHEENIYHSGGDEHGVIVPCGDFKVGDQVWLIPGHCDPTVNMHDWLFGVRNGKVECVWQITGRGPGV